MKKIIDIENTHTISLEKAKTLVGKKFTIWGDRIEKYDVENVEQLNDFISMYVAVDGQSYIKGNSVIYVPYQ